MPFIRIVLQLLLEAIRHALLNRPMHLELTRSNTGFQIRVSVQPIDGRQEKPRPEIHYHGTPGGYGYPGQQWMPYVPPHMLPFQPQQQGQQPQPAQEERHPAPPRAEPQEVPESW